VSKYFVWTVFILLLILMFVPSFMSARFAENENAAKSYLRMLHEANEIYRKIQRPAEYAATLAELALGETNLADVEHVQAQKKGYRISYERINGDYYQLIAEPIYKFLTGYQTFFIDQTGVIRLNNAEGAPIDA